MQAMSLPPVSAVVRTVESHDAQTLPTVGGVSEPTKRKRRRRGTAKKLGQAKGNFSIPGSGVSSDTGRMISKWLNSLSPNEKSYALAKLLRMAQAAQAKPIETVNAK